MPHRVIAVVTDELHGEESVRQIFGRGNGDGVDVRVVVPAIEANALEHTLGDVDGPRQHAEERLQRALEVLRQNEGTVSGEVGDPDPVRAAQDALLKAPADEVLFFDHCESQAQWYESGLLERAEEEIELPLRMVFVEHTDGQPDHVVKVEGKGSGTINPHAGKEFSGGAYVPGMTRADVAGIIAGITGTIVAAVLAAVAAGSQTDTGWVAVAILVAIGAALANLAHVVGLTLFETVNYRGGFARFFRTLALVGTPLAVVVNAAIVIFS
jgi:hypothetical protein